ncbi:PREDICTED: uncharacterized protein LOC104784184 [Camelina sativa]|uniref:Uncharacterized protein LOC104784184 n=1 Tax=Camelina sativa TaxID=90675 RepID=A0ABM0YXP0_CAMSA|nr:PREDICTED: uncharacterized protein LOC104784184 [Camelina sativa]
MAMQQAISIGKTRGGLSYRSLSCGKYKSLNHVDTLGKIKVLEAINVPSTQTEALTGAITSGLESVMEKVKADITKSQEYQSQSARVAEEVRKLQADIDKMRADRRCDHDINIHNKIEQGFNELKAEFKATKNEVVKVAIYTLASVAVAGSGMFCLMS